MHRSSSHLPNLWEGVGYEILDSKALLQRLEEWQSGDFVGLTRRMIEDQSKSPADRDSGLKNLHDPIQLPLRRRIAQGIIWIWVDFEK